MAANGSDYITITYIWLTTMKGDIRFLKQHIASFIIKMNPHGIDIYTHIHESNDYHVLQIKWKPTSYLPSNKKQTTNIPMNHPTILRANPTINPMEIPSSTPGKFVLMCLPGAVLRSLGWSVVWEFLGTWAKNHGVFMGFIGISSRDLRVSQCFTCRVASYI